MGFQTAHLIPGKDGHSSKSLNFILVSQILTGLITIQYSFSLCSYPDHCPGIISGSFRMAKRRCCIWIWLADKDTNLQWAAVCFRISISPLRLLFIFFMSKGSTVDSSMGSWLSRVDIRGIRRTLRMYFSSQLCFNKLSIIVEAILGYLQFYSMSQTPYQLLLKKQRDRKFQLYTKIQMKDPRNRSVGCKIKIEQESDDPQTKNKEKHKVNFSSSIKKSFLCRKFLNRTVEGHANSEQFRKFKEQIAKGNRCEISEQNKKYKQIWEQRKNHSKELQMKGLEKSLEIKPKNKEQKQNKTGNNQPVLVFKRNSDEKIQRVCQQESIHDIAQRRKDSIDFDLEVQGNKKKIRIKDVCTSKSSARKKFQSLQLQQQLQVRTPQPSSDPHEFSFLPKGKFQATKSPVCTFFQRFKEKHYPKDQEANQSDSLLVSKVKYNLGKLYELSSDWTFERSLTGEPRMNDTPARIRRQIRTSWNSHHGQESRYPKSTTAEVNRNPLRRHHKQIKPNFTNDIEGWNVGDEREEDDLIFGS